MMTMPCTGHVNQSNASLAWDERDTLDARQRGLHSASGLAVNELTLLKTNLRTCYIHNEYAEFKPQVKIESR